MSRPALRLAHPGQLPAPATGDDSRTVLTKAVDALARLRAAYRLGDSAVHPHTLASRIAQAEQPCPEPPATRNSGSPP